MSLDPDVLADMVIRTIKQATAPLLVKIAALEARPVIAPDVIDLLTENGADLRTRLIALETRAPVPGPMGPAGADGIGIPGDRGPIGERGKDVDMSVVQHMIDTLLTKAVATIPAPKDGTNGKDGVSPDPEAVRLMVKTAVTEAVQALPPAKDGRDGVTPDPEAVRLMVKAAVTEAVQALPPAKDGRDGTGLMGAVIDRDGHLILTLSDGQSKDLGGIVGKDGCNGLQGKDVDMGAVESQIRAAIDAIPRPKDGKDGADGLGFDDAGVVFTESEGWEFRMAQGERVKTQPLHVPFYAGVWQSGRTYPKGACVTHGGSQWTALDATSARPGDESAASRAWKLSVKGGKDGKQGPPGRDGSNG